MSKIYQPIVLEKAVAFIESLVESEFFKDYEINSTDFAKKYICDRLTEKFISGQLDEITDEFLTEEELDTYLREIVAGSLLYELKEKGLMNSYEDDDTEETFFLTDEGKVILEKIKEDNEFFSKEEGLRILGRQK
jgi:hypothetical protein